MKKILISNLTGIIIVLIITEFLSFLIIIFKYYSVIRNESIKGLWKNWFSFNQMRIMEDGSDKFIPTCVYKGTEDDSIVLLGCSYAWGACLNYKDKPSTQLANYLKRTVYNRAICSTGTASALYIMSQDKIKQEIPNAKYFIYIFLIDHLRRNSVMVPNHLYNQFSAKYSIDKNGNLKFNKYNKLQYLFFSSYTYRLYEERERYNRKESDYLLFGAIMDRLAATIKEKYPNSEFIVLFYDDNYDELKSISHNAKIDEICKRNNIKLIYTSDLKCGQDIFDRKYIAEDNLHPSKEAWEHIIPEFTEKAGIK